MNELVTHPQGDEKNQALAVIAGPVPVDTFGGRVHVEGVADKMAWRA